MALQLIQLKLANKTSEMQLKKFPTTTIQYYTMKRTSKQTHYNYYNQKIYPYTTYAHPHNRLQEQITFLAWD